MSTLFFEVSRAFEKNAFFKDIGHIVYLWLKKTNVMYRAFRLYTIVFV